jgi:periplasmic protein TonB
MRERSEIISNTSGLAVVAGLTALFIFAPPALPELPPQAAGPDVEISLEAPPEQAPPEPAVEAPPPPPPPPPPEEPPPPEPPKTVDTQQDPDAEAAQAARQEENASAFRACLQKTARYPSSKEARKYKPHGAVVVKAIIAKGVITGVEVIKSSGSAVLDEAAKASVMKSGCGSKVEGNSVAGTIMY